MYRSATEQMKGILVRLGRRISLLVGVGLTAVAVIAFALTALVHSQAGNDLPPFDSGSNGSDGALILETPGTILFDPRNFNHPLDQDGDGVYHFTEIRIGAGVTVKLSSVPLGTKPVVWLAQGAVQIDGTVDLDGENGHDQTTISRPSISGAGGYGGAAGGGVSGGIDLNGDGPGAGRGGRIDQQGSGAGHASPGRQGAGGLPGGSPYGNNFLSPLLGGSGGGAGGNAGGGAGGGAILITSSVRITVDGTVTASGGNGGVKPTCCRSGGGGSGGAIRIMAPIINGTGFLNVGYGSGDSPIRLGDGSLGRMRLEAFRHEFTGRTNPTPTRSTPGPVFPLLPQPTVRVLSVAGANVPSNPAGDLLRPDLTIDSQSNAEIQIQSQNIPAGTKVQLNIFSENGTGQVVESTPLDMHMNGRATASVTLPPGISRFHVQATWTP